MSAAHGIDKAGQVQGKQMSYYNFANTDAAFELVANFPADQLLRSVIKHAFPCGVDSGATSQDS